MNDAEVALESTVAALADSQDQLVFLQQAVGRAVNARGVEDLLILLEDALELLGAEGTALYVNGFWVGTVPAWLADEAPPERLTYTLAGTHPDAPAAFLGVPFERGWVAFWTTAGTFQSGDGRLAQTLANLISSTLDAIWLRERQLQQDIEHHDQALAARIWRYVVPEHLSAPKNYQLASLSQPALQVGGDFHVAVDGWVVVGDVSGKGIAAALFTGMFVSALRLAVQHADMGAAIAGVLHPQLESAGMLATVVAVRLQPNGTFEYFNMGHPPILVRRAGGQIESLGPTAPPLGTFAFDSYPTERGQLYPGDMMFLYSDGLNEAQRLSPEEKLELFGLWKVRHTLAHAAETPTLALPHLTQALNGWDVVDDLTMVLLQYVPQAPARPEGNSVLELHLPADTAQLAALGTFIRDACHDLDQPGLPELAVTELAVNAIVHGGARHLLAIVRRVPGGCLVTLEDDGRAFDPTAQEEKVAGELREGGYGLLIVRRSASELHYRRRFDWNSIELTYLRGASL